MSECTIALIKVKVIVLLRIVEIHLCGNGVDLHQVIGLERRVDVIFGWMGNLDL